MLQTSLRRLALTCAAIAAVACGGDSSTGPGASIQGTYSLSTFNGQSLPFTVNETVGTDVYSITYMSPFTISLNSDNTLRIISTSKFTMNGFSETSTDTLGGTWTMTGTTVSLKTSDGETVPATWNGSNQLTISSPPDVLVFKK